MSYDEKHNEANGEENRDGHSNNHSWNHGAEGPTDDPEIRALRERQKRNLMATLLLSQGTPMILAGDEFGHTQRGMNNAYAQDNEITWLDWDAVDDDGRALLEFTPTAHGDPRDPTRSCTAAGSCRASATRSSTSRTSPGSPPTAPRWGTSTGPTAARAPSRCCSTGGHR